MLIGGDLADAAAGAQLDAGTQRVRPIGDVDAGLGALGAAGSAMAEIDALGAAVVLGGGDRDIRRPPVPAELVDGLGIFGAGAAERRWRHGRLMGGVGRIAGEAGNAHHAVVLGEVGLQRPIIDRPVIGDAIERFDAEVGGVHAREMGGVEHRAAANAIEVCDLHRRVVVVDGIVGIARAAIGTDVEIGEAAGFPVAAVAREIGGLDPVALLEAEDLHARLGEAPGDSCAGGARADDQHVDDVVGGTWGGVGCVCCHVSVPCRRYRATCAGGCGRDRAATSRPAVWCVPWGTAREARGHGRA